MQHTQLRKSLRKRIKLPFTLLVLKLVLVILDFLSMCECSIMGNNYQKKNPRELVTTNSPLQQVAKPKF